MDVQEEYIIDKIDKHVYEAKREGETRPDGPRSSKACRIAEQDDRVASLM
jgi:hypothetical protein